MELVTEVRSRAVPEAWNPAPTFGSISSYIVFAFWTCVQPLIDGVWLREPPWLGLAQWFLGSVVIAVVALLGKYRRAAPYRSSLAVARAAHADSLVFGVRLDPLTTPVGTEWGDSRRLRWGLLRASPDGVEIVRSDGLAMLRRPWSGVEFSIRGIDVESASATQEWWFQLMSDSGIVPAALLVRTNRNRFLRLQGLHFGSKP